MTDSAVEAAAAATFDVYRCGNCGDGMCPMCMTMRRAMYAAAMPAIREAIAQEDPLGDALRSLDGATREAPPVTCDNGQANTCRHDSASGMDTSFGPGKVWRCDHCGLRWIEGYSPHDERAARTVRDTP